MSSADRFPHIKSLDDAHLVDNIAAGISADSKPTAAVFAEEQVAAFERDGFLVVSGLLEDEVDDLVDAGEAFVHASKKMKAYFSSIEMGMIFQAGKTANDTITRAFRQVALDSILPRAAAELMRLPKNQRVRVLR